MIGEQKIKAALLPQILSVLVVSLGCLIHGSSVVYVSYAQIGLKNESETIVNLTTNETALGFDYDSARDDSWLCKLEVRKQFL